MEKYDTARQATDGNIMLRRKDVLFLPDNYGKNTGTQP
jgi:hypothetical protein